MQTLYEKTKKKNQLSITERIKTFEDACDDQSIDNLQLELLGLDEGATKAVVAYIKLLIITKALNEDWVADLSNTNQYKYYPWFKKPSGFGLAYLVYDGWVSYSTVGVRLAFKSAELAEYAGKQFIDIYNDFIL